MKIEFKKEEVQAILNYLAQKPYAEVFQLVNLLASKLPKEEKQEEKK